MEYKASELILEENGVDDRTIRGFFAVMGVLDAHGDIIRRGAFEKTIAQRAARIRVLWQHDASLPPIGKVLSIREVSRESLPPFFLRRFPDAEGALYAEVRILPTPRGDEILAGIREGAISEASIGFETLLDQIEVRDGRRVRILKEIRLWDISPVNWAANEAAWLFRKMEGKAAVPYRDTGTADEDTPWEAPTLSDFTDETFEELTVAERKRIGAHFAWAANWPPEKFGDLKLPHHKPSRSVVGPAVWNGVRAAMGALFGARGGVDIPDGDRKEVYDHLAKHYRQFDKEPPDFKFLQALWAAQRANEALRFLVEEAPHLIRHADRMKETIRCLADWLAEARDPERRPAHQAAGDPVDALTRLVAMRKRLLEL